MELETQDVNSRPSSFAVYPFLPLHFLGSEIYRDNVYSGCSEELQNYSEQW